MPPGTISHTNGYSEKYSKTSRVGYLLTDVVDSGLAVLLLREGVSPRPATLPSFDAIVLASSARGWTVAHADLAAEAPPHNPGFQTVVFCRVPRGMRSIHPHKCYWETGKDRGRAGGDGGGGNFWSPRSYDWQCGLVVWTTVWDG